MCDLRADAERCNVREESLATIRKLHTPNIYASCRHTARQRTRRRHRITRNTRRSRVVTPGSCGEKTKRHARERINSACCVRTVHRLATRTISTEHRDARHAGAHGIRGGAFSGTRFTGLSHVHIKRLQRRQLFEDAIECACGTTAACGGIDDQKRAVRDLRLLSVRGGSRDRSDRSRREQIGCCRSCARCRAPRG